MQSIAAKASGFIYYVSREGVTGERSEIVGGLKERVDEIKQYTDLPVVVGFGISNGDHVRTAAAAADGVVVGSALVKCVQDNVGNEENLERATI